MEVFAVRIAMYSQALSSLAAAKNLISEDIYDLSKPLESRMASSSGRFTTYGKRLKIDAENWAQLDKETEIIKPGSYEFLEGNFLRVPFGISEFRYTK